MKPTRSFSLRFTIVSPVAFFLLLLLNSIVFLVAAGGVTLRKIRTFKTFDDGATTEITEAIQGQCPSLLQCVLLAFSDL